MAKHSGKSLDAKGFGQEPEKGTDLSNDPSGYSWAKRYYNYHSSQDNVVKYLKTWAKKFGEDEIMELLLRVEKNHVTSSFGHLARMLTRDVKLPDSAMEYFESQKAKFLEYAPKHQKKVTTDEDKERNARRAAAKSAYNLNKARDEIEELQWRFLEKRGKHSFTAKSLKARHNLSDADMKTLANEMKPLITELGQLIGKNPPADLREGYRNVKNHKGYYAIMSEVYNDIVFESSAKKATRKSRKPKPVSVEKMFKSVKSQMEDTELKIRGMKPEDVHGAPRIWVYSTKYKKIMMFEAKAGGIKAKGASLDNIAKAVAKTLRKPDEQVQLFMKGSSISRKKRFDEIKTKEQESSLRFADHYVILKADK